MIELKQPNLPESGSIPKEPLALPSQASADNATVLAVKKGRKRGMRVVHCTMIVCMLLWATLPAPARELPNVVVILADDIGYGDLGVYGGRIPTPNLDRLAREGMRFTDTQSPAALCAPSRFSMLTGSYPYRSYNAGGAWNTNRPSIFSDPLKHTRAGRHITVAEMMRNAGYRTAFFGKSHLGGDIRDGSGELIRDPKMISKMDFARGVRQSINEYGFDYSYFLPSGIQHAPFAFFKNGSFLPFDSRKPADNRSTRLWVNGRYTMGGNGTSEIVKHREKNPGIGDVDYDSTRQSARPNSTAWRGKDRGGPASTSQPRSARPAARGS